MRSVIHQDSLAPGVVVVCSDCGKRVDSAIRIDHFTNADLDIDDYDNRFTFLCKDCVHQCFVLTRLYVVRKGEELEAKRPTERNPQQEAEGQDHQHLPKSPEPLNMSEHQLREAADWSGSGSVNEL